MTRKSNKYPHVTYGTLNSCLDLIGSYQQSILRSKPLEIKPATPECRNRTSTIYIYIYIYIYIVFWSVTLQNIH